MRELQKTQQRMGGKLRKKECTKCKETKSLRDYYLLKDKGQYRYKSWCKACVCKYVRMARKKTTVKKKRDPFYKEYQRMYYRTHREEFRRYRKEFLNRHPNYFRERYARQKQQQEDLKSALVEGELNA